MKQVHKLSWYANFAAYLAIPVSCAVMAFCGAFGIWVLPDSVGSIFGDLSIIWAQFWFWGCLFITVGIILKRFRDTNLYIWFEYPGLIIGAFFALVYAGALLDRFDISTSFLAISAFTGIGLRFLFRWFEVHFLLMDTLRNADSKHDRE